MTTKAEVCADCGQPKPIALILRNEKTGEDKPLCRICANRWLLSDEEWPPEKQTKVEAFSLRNQRKIS